MATGHSSSQQIFAALGFMGHLHINDYLDSTAAFGQETYYPGSGCEIFYQFRKALKTEHVRNCLCYKSHLTCLNLCDVCGDIWKVSMAGGRARLMLYHSGDPGPSLSH